MATKETKERSECVKLVERLVTAIKEAESEEQEEPWTELQPLVTMLQPAMTDAGLIWEYTGSSQEGIWVGDGTLGGFWLLDTATEQFVAMDSVQKVKRYWISSLREQVLNASNQQVSNYLLWARAARQK